MKSDINDLCEAFLAALTNAGYAVKSIENYKQVSNRFKKFCAENGYDTYTVHTAAASGRWCGAERPRCGLSNSRH